MPGTVLGPQEDPERILHVRQAVGVVGIQKVAEVQRRLIFRGIALEAEGVTFQATVGTTRKIVSVADKRVGRWRVTDGAIARLRTRVGQVVATRRIESEVEARTAILRDPAFIKRGINSVSVIGAPLCCRVPEVVVQVRESDAPSRATSVDSILSVNKDRL